MCKFVLIEKNIDSLKSLLTKEYPQVKSSHLTEAIARGLKFGSNAALRDFLSNKTTIYNRLFDFNKDSFKNWLFDKSYEGNFNVSDSVLERIFLPPWVISNKIEDQNAHYFLCKDFQIPYIVIKPKRNKSDIHWDCIGFDHEHDATMLDSNLSKKIRELGNLYGTKNALFVPSLFVGTIMSVENENVRILAGEIFANICLALEQNKAN